MLLLALGSVPVLLLGKPLMIRSRQRAVHTNRRDDSFSSESQLIDELALSSGMGQEAKGANGHDVGHANGGGHDDHDFSEVVIHQVR